jgi:hypothetical protein
MAMPYWMEEETHDVSKVIVGAERIKRIDFGDRGDDVTSKLTDKDVYHILNCVDAVNNLERLFLTHCYKVKGHGLEPLSGSTRLQQIDLSLLSRFEAPTSPDDNVEDSLSTEAIVPLMNSIIESRIVGLDRSNGLQGGQRCGLCIVISDSCSQDSMICQFIVRNATQVLVTLEKSKQHAMIV